MLESHLPPVEMARITSAAVRPDIRPIANGNAICKGLKGTSLNSTLTDSAGESYLSDTAQHSGRPLPTSRSATILASPSDTYMPIRGG
jgi:hypothetical protein